VCGRQILELETDAMIMNVPYAEGRVPRLVRLLSLDGPACRAHVHDTMRLLAAEMKATGQELLGGLMFR
jgi:hypothetical protein